MPGSDRDAIYDAYQQMMAQGDKKDIGDKEEKTIRHQLYNAKDAIESAESVIDSILEKLPNTYAGDIPKKESEVNEAKAKFNAKAAELRSLIETYKGIGETPEECKANADSARQQVEEFLSQTEPAFEQKLQEFQTGSQEVLKKHQAYIESLSGFVPHSR